MFFRYHFVENFINLTLYAYMEIFKQAFRRLGSPSQCGDMQNRRQEVFNEGFTFLRGGFAFLQGALQFCRGLDNLKIEKNSTDL